MDLLFLAILGLVAFLPSLIYMVAIRNTERYEREPWRAVLKSFFIGATFGIILAAILELVAVDFYATSFRFLREYEFIARHKESVDALVLAVIIAPFVEEATKAYGIFASRRYIDEIEDGLVYGASSGFGFAATENLLYEFTAFLHGGIISWFSVALIRSISSALIHGSATALTGLGYSLKKFGRGSALRGYLSAVFLHSSFNLLASIPIILRGYEETLYLVPLFLAIIYGIAAFSYIRRKIRYYDLPRRKR